MTDNEVKTATRISQAFILVWQNIRMNDDDLRLLSSWADQLSPMLDENYDLLKKLERVPVCVACPMAQWYKLEFAPPKQGLEKPGIETKPPTLECFCTAFRGVMYDGRRVVTACDARTDALKAKDEDPA